MVQFCREFLFKFRAFKYRYRKSIELLQREAESVVVTYDDRMPSLISILKAAEYLRIPVFLPSLLNAYPNKEAITFNVLKNRRYIEKLLLPIIKLLAPNQLSEEPRMFYDPVAFFVLLLNRSLPKNPWAKGSLHFTSKIGVESEYVYFKLIEYSVDREKMVITGLPVYDFMNFAEEDASSGDNVLVCALPQYGEHGAMTVDRALPLIRELLESLNDFSGKVIISIHPRMNPEVYKPEIDKFGYACVLGDIDNMLRKCSVFVAASSSSTIYWALMLGVRTVVLNHTKPKSDLFKDFQSLDYIEKNIKAEMPKILEKSKHGWEDLIEEDKNLLSKPLVADGKCGYRNMLILKELQKDKLLK